MKRLFVTVLALPALILSLSGCNTAGGKNASLSIVYLAVTVLSL